MFEGADQKKSDLIELLRAIRENNPVVLEKIYREQYYKTEQFILNNNGTRDDAKDIYQQAFTVLWRNVQLDKLNNQNVESIAGYLLKIVKHKWIDHLRSAYVKHGSNSIESDSIFLIEEDLTDEEQEAKLNLIKLCFHKLGEDCKKVLTDFYYKKKSLKAIALKMGWAETTARNNKYRCIEKLRTLVYKKNETLE